MTQTEHSNGRIDNFVPSADRQADNTGTVLNQARRLAEQLQMTLSVLATIDQAIGILIGRGGGSPEEATAALRDVSRSHGTDLATVSRQIVEEVSRQAQVRHVQREERRQGTPAAGGRSTRGCGSLILRTGVESTDRASDRDA